MKVLLNRITLAGGFVASTLALADTVRTKPDSVSSHFARIKRCSVDHITSDGFTWPTIVLPETTDKGESEVLALRSERDSQIYTRAGIAKNFRTSMFLCPLNGVWGRSAARRIFAARVFLVRVDCSDRPCVSAEIDLHYGPYYNTYNPTADKHSFAHTPAEWSDHHHDNFRWTLRQKSTAVTYGLRLADECARAVAVDLPGIRAVPGWKGGISEIHFYAMGRASGTNDLSFSRSGPLLIRDGRWLRPGESLRDESFFVASWPRAVWEHREPRRILLCRGPMRAVKTVRVLSFKED